MKEKIEWYQEVLELEPGSKVFFPLARLLAASGQVDRAVQTLRRGLDRHPEFIEARLYLIDLLFRHGLKEQCEEQVGYLSPLFSRYEGFWQAWGNSLVASGKQGDAGLALVFLAAAFQQNTLSLSDVMSRGLEAVLRAEDSSAAPDQREFARGTSDVPSQSPPHAPRGPVPSTSVAAMLSPLAELVQSLPTEPTVTPEGSGAQGLESMPHVLQGASATEERDVALQEEGDDAEERFSLRTRSMAEVLAEQGDFAGALEIYQELSSQATSPEEAADLQYRISTLTAHLGAVQEPAPALEPAPSPSKHRVLSVLEALAERLESRVHG